MGKTYKDSDGVTHRSSSRKASKKKPVDAKPTEKEKKVKVRGAKPDFTRKVEEVTAKKYRGYDDLDDLFRATMDNYIYQVKDLEFEKQFHAPYKGSPDIEICVVCVSVPKDSQYERNGLKAGIRIRQSNLWKEGFKCTIADEATRAGVQTMYDFLRNYAPTATTTESTVTVESTPAVTDPTEASAILFGKSERNCCVVANGVTFEVATLTNGRPVIYTRHAPQESGLLDAELNRKLFLPMSALHSDTFYSTLDEKIATIQKSVWVFIRNFLAENDLITKAPVVVEESFDGDIGVIFNPDLKDADKCIKFQVGNRKFKGEILTGQTFGIIKEVGFNSYVTMNMLLSPKFFGVEESETSKLHKFLRFAHFGEEKAEEVETKKVEAIKAETCVVKNQVCTDAGEASAEVREFYFGNNGLYRFEEDGSNAYFRLTNGEIKFEGANNAHKLGVLQAKGKVNLGTGLKLIELRSEKPNLVGCSLNLSEELCALHGYLREVGISLGIKSKPKAVAEKQEEVKKKNGGVGYLRRKAHQAKKPTVGVATPPDAVKVDPALAAKLLAEKFNTTNKDGETVH